MPQFDQPSGRNLRYASGQSRALRGRTDRTQAAQPGRNTSSRRTPAEARAEAATGSILLLLFVFALITPVWINVGPILLSPDRIFLLASIIPLLIKLVSGGAGRIQPVDILIFLFCIWHNIALVANHGWSQWQFMGINSVEMLGGYLVGRCLIRSDMDYRTFFRYFLYGLMFLLPFVLLEQFTRRMFLSEILGTVFVTFPYVDFDQRLGLNRVQAAFEHPILYGLFCSLGIGNFFYLYRDKIAKALSATGLATFMTFMSLSSGCLLAAVLQIGMIIWGGITKANWKLLAILAVLGYFAIDLLSNRSPAQVLISYATLNQSSAYNRIHIWTYGTQNVANNPIFGIGLGRWERPGWMPTSSMDNFWLLNAVRYGLPAISLLMIGISASFWRLLRRQKLNRSENQCRTAYMVAAVGFFFTLATVHIWGSTWVFFMFYIGAGVWIADAGTEPEKVTPGDKRKSREARSRQRSQGAAAHEPEPEKDTAASAPVSTPRTRRRRPATSRE